MALREGWVPPRCGHLLLAVIVMLAIVSARGHENAGVRLVEYVNFAIGCFAIYFSDRTSFAF